jgi:putative SOS response-associated peptidase YedK
VCGRYSITRPGDIVGEILEPLGETLAHLAAEGRIGAGVEGLLARPRFNLAPTQEALVLRQPIELRPLVENAIWNFRRGAGAPVINARAESLEDRSLFRSALALGRCLVPADGFYEWHQTTRQPYRFGLAGGRGFAFAGLFTAAGSPDAAGSGRFCIVTTAAGGPVVGIHDRMPVILHTDELLTWLDPELDPELDPGVLRSLLAAPRPSLFGYPVGAGVNRVAIDEPSLVEPAPKAPENLSLL